MGILELSGFFGLVILILDIYAILKTVKSDASPGGMALWIAIIAFLPVLGFILWVLFGPAAPRQRI